MKRTAILLIFLLISCAPALATKIAPTPSAAPVATVSAVLPSPAPAAAPPLSTPTFAACDPLAAAYCLTAGHFVFARPILPPANDAVEETYRFASTALGSRDPHHGVEFENGTGVPVHAAAGGRVIFAGPDEEAIYSPWPNFYGNVIVIRHAEELFTLYAHLSAINVNEGVEVLVGEKIGEVGMTGSASGSHLHFEVRRGDAEDYFSALNPELWLLPRPGEGALAISVVNGRGEFARAKLTIRSDHAAYFIETYEEVLLARTENAALGLKEGRYRIALVYGGKIYERWIEVQSGRLTQVVVVVE